MNTHPRRGRPGLFGGTEKHQNRELLDRRKMRTWVPSAALRKFFNLCKPQLPRPPNRVVEPHQEGLSGGVSDMSQVVYTSMSLLFPNRWGKQQWGMEPGVWEEAEC